MIFIWLFDDFILINVFILIDVFGVFLIWLCLDVEREPRQLMTPRPQEPTLSPVGARREDSRGVIEREARVRCLRGRGRAVMEGEGGDCPWASGSSGRIVWRACILWITHWRRGISSTCSSSPTFMVCDTYSSTVAAFVLFDLTSLDHGYVGPGSGAVAMLVKVLDWQFCISWLMMMMAQVQVPVLLLSKSLGQAIRRLNINKCMAIIICAIGILVNIILKH